MQFKAAMFDFDGTITRRGEFYPSQEMADALVDLAQKMPIAFCTGRQLESFVDHGLDYLMEEIGLDRREPFLENLFLIGENGSIGYDFDPKKHEFVEFYRTDWPDSFITRDDLKAQLAEIVTEYGEIFERAHRVVLVIRTKHHLSGDIEKIHECSDRIYEICRDFLLDLDEDYEKYLHVGNSGIGVVICPADGDKDAGIREFGKRLEETRGMKFEENYREIMAVGDNPQVGGNDHYFLNGRYGSPFTVGYMVDENKVLKAVFGKNGGRLLHERGTLELIRRVL